MGIYKTDKERTELGQDKYSRDLLTEEPANLKTEEVSSTTQQLRTQYCANCIKSSGKLCLSSLSLRSCKYPQLKMQLLRGSSESNE